MVHFTNQAHEMSLEERRALVIKDLVADSQEDLLLAQTETRVWLEQRLIHFMSWIGLQSESATDMSDEDVVNEYLEALEDNEGMEAYNPPSWVPAPVVRS